MNDLQIPQYKEKYGLPTATTMVIGSIVGSGIFALPSAMAKYGPLSLVAFLLVTFGALMLAMAFGIMFKRQPRSGGEYVFTRHAFGDFAGYLSAWAFWLSCWTATAAVVTALTGYVQVFINKDENPVISIIIALVALWVPAFICISGVKNMGKAQFVLTALKFIPLLILSVVGLFNFKWENLGEFNPSGESLVPALLGASAVGIYSYLGVEAGTATASRVKDPEKNVPKAQFWGMILTALLYVVSIVAVMGTVPHDKLVDSTAPFADSATAIFGGDWAGAVVAVLAVVACFGLLVGWTLVTAEVPAEAAKDGVFPAFFASQNKKEVPVKGILLSTVLASILVIFAYTNFKDVFTTMLLLNVVVSVLPYIFATCSELYWMAKEGKAGIKTAKFAKNLFIITFALAFSIWAFIGTGTEAMSFATVAMLAGLPVFAYSKYKAKQTQLAL